MNKQEKNETNKVSHIKKYIKNILRTVISFALIDLVTAIIIVSVLFLSSRFICFLFNLDTMYVNISTIIIGFLYIISILFTSVWRHFSALRSSTFSNN